MKENVILGKLIPAGTGMESLRKPRVEPTTQARADYEKLNNIVSRDFESFDDIYSYSSDDFDSGLGYGFGSSF